MFFNSSNPAPAGYSTPMQSGRASTPVAPRISSGLPGLNPPFGPGMEGKSASDGGLKKFPQAVRRTVRCLPNGLGYNKDIGLKQIILTVGGFQKDGREAILNIPQANELLSQAFSSKMIQQDRTYSDYDKVPEHKVMLQAADDSCSPFDTWVDRSNAWLDKARQWVLTAPTSSFKNSQDRADQLAELDEMEKKQAHDTQLLKQKTADLQKGVSNGHAFDTLVGISNHMRLAGVVGNIQQVTQGESLYRGHTLAAHIGGWYSQVLNTFAERKDLIVGTKLFLILRRGYDPIQRKWTAFEFFTWAHKDHDMVPKSMLAYYDPSGNIQYGKSWEIGRIQYFDGYKKTRRATQMKSIGLSGGVQSGEAAQTMADLPILTIRIGTTN